MNNIDEKILDLIDRYRRKYHSPPRYLVVNQYTYTKIAAETNSSTSYPHQVGKRKAIWYGLEVLRRPSDYKEELYIKLIGERGEIISTKLGDINT